MRLKIHIWEYPSQTHVICSSFRPKAPVAPFGPAGSTQGAPQQSYRRSISSTLHFARNEECKPTSKPFTAGHNAAADRPPKKETVVNETHVRGTISTVELKNILFVVQSLCAEFGKKGEFHDYDRVYTPSPETRMPKTSSASAST